MTDHSNDSPNPGFETSDAHIKPLVIMGVVVLLLMVGAFIGIIPLFKILGYYQPLFDEPVSLMAPERVTELSEPRLEIDPPRQKYVMTSQYNEVLNNYAWVDKELNIAQIPIQRTIELVGKGTLALPKALPAQ